eukprot:NODE_283_length_10814_cov_0.705460.p6 type:complete len:273 gc:universal NODE_283_length_10814_cov_0.705460:8964-8146(-)
MDLSDDENLQAQISPIESPATDLQNVPTQELLDSESDENITFDPFIPRYANDDLFCKVPIPLREHILMKVIRNKEGSLPSYNLFLERTEELYLLFAKKKFGSQTYEIYSDSKADKFLGKVSCNFLGTVFTVEDDNGVEIACVLYRPNILGFKGPRCMTIILPSLKRSGERLNIESTLHDAYKSGSKDVVVLQNKTPLWNEETNSYVLNFNGRVTVASVKNFQITPDQDLDYIMLQFGRISTDRFTLDCRYPVTIVQAFGIALTSFESKLACE